MLKKINVVGIFLLLGCLLSLSTVRIAEAKHTPEHIITTLQARLDSVLSTAQYRNNTGTDALSAKVTNLVNQFNSNAISRTAFCSALTVIKGTSNNKRAAYDAKIARLATKARNQLARINANISYITDATNRENAAHADKAALFDTLDAQIAAAKQVPSPSC